MMREPIVDCCADPAPSEQTAISADSFFPGTNMHAPESSQPRLIRRCDVPVALAETHSQSGLVIPPWPTRQEPSDFVTAPDPLDLTWRQTKVRPRAIGRTP